MKVALVFIRDKRFFSRPSSKFLARRKKDPYPGDKRHYVFGEPPLGIMYLSSVLKLDGHQVTLTDQCHPEYSDEKLIDSLTEQRPEIIGISFLSNMCYPAARALSRKIKAACPAAKIVYGGVFPTINAHKIIACENSVDIVARGEGEEIIRELTDGHTELSDIAGITFRNQSGKIIETPDREGIRDLNTIPFPDRDNIDINYVASLPLDVPAVIWDLPYTTIVSSRGCPFACTYCNCPTFSHRKCRFRSVDNVLKELDLIASQGYRSFCFLDDNFLLDIDRANGICKAIKDHHLSFRWACEGRAETKTNGVFQQLSDAGCDVVMFGIESGSQRVLNSMNKKTKIPEIEIAVAKAKKAGISIIHGFFIVGTPGETVEEVEETFRFADKIEINSFAFNSLTAFRGTALWNDAVSRGLIDEEKDWDKMFPTHMIYPDAIASQTLFKLRSTLVKRLIFRKIFLHPLQAAKIFARFLKCMSIGDLYRLLTSTKKNCAAKPAAN